MSKKPSAVDQLKAVEKQVRDSAGSAHAPAAQAGLEAGGQAPQNAMGANTTWEYWGNGTGWEVAPDGSYTGDYYGWD